MKMFSRLMAAMVILLPAIAGQAQSADPGGYRDFPLVLSIQFHSLSLPFRHIGSNFKNIGFGIGTEAALNSSATAVQQLQLVWFHNKTVGNGILIYTQSAWRPGIGANGFGELKAGVGYMHEFRPVTAYKKVNGEWVSEGRKGKGMLAIPLGASVGYQQYATSSYVAPFVTYQFIILTHYSQSIPIVPQTLIQVGARIHPQ
jgi:hypothetical protein